MRGESLPEARLYWHGLDGDRRYAFVRQGANSGFPWFTGRELPQLLLYTPRLLQPEEAQQSPIEVMTPDGGRLLLDAPELKAALEQAYGKPVFLFRLDRGAFDSQVLSLMSTTSVKALGEQATMPIESSRFRQNILIETRDGRPFQEDEWLDRVLVFGSDSNGPRIRINRRIVRCVMVNIDPRTAECEARVLKTVAQTRDSCAGVYASVEKPGIVRVDDPVTVI
jgi:uncharacterized protein YcbX